MERIVPYNLRHTLHEPDMAPINESETTVENNDNFITQSRRKSIRTRTQSQTSSEIEISNQFSALETVEEEQTDPLPPPEINTYKANVQNISGNLLMTLTGTHKEQVKIRYANNCLIIRTTGDEAKNHVINQLRSNQIQFETIITDRDLSEKVTIKGLPPSISVEEIKNELIAREFPVTNVRQIVKNTTIEGKKISEPLPVWVLTLTKTQSLQDKLLTLNALFHIRIRVEKYRGIQGVKTVLQLSGLRTRCTPVQQESKMCEMWRKP